MRLRAGLFAVLLLTPLTGHGETAGPPLVLEGKIALGPVRGRIDHLAIDLKRGRLFVAELGNNSIGVVDTTERKLQRTLAGLKEPQGIGYEPSGDTVYIANAADGSVRVLRAEDLAVLGRIDLGEGADNVRIDTAHQRVLVGFGTGALAVIDPKSRTRGADIPLKAHPESFQIDEGSGRAFVNLPDARTIAVVDLAKGAVIGSLPTQGHRANFPMALDRDRQRVLVVFRSPPRLLVVSMSNAVVLADIETCADADDVFADPKRRRVYISCGAGLIDILEEVNDRYQRTGELHTAPGARTSLFVPAQDRLYLAVRAAGPEPAAIWVYRPQP